MAAALAEASNDSSRDMQMAKEHSLDTLNIPNETNTASNGECNTAKVNGEAVSATATATNTLAKDSTYAMSAISANAAESDDGDATMHTPSASPVVSFDAGAVISKATTADVTTTGSDSGSGISITSKAVSGGGGAAAGSVTASSDELENAAIPQWKKELIQRRKANIARTIGANQPGACSKKGTTNPSTTMAAGTATTATAVSPTSPVLSIAKNFCNDSTFIRGKISTPTNNSSSNNNSGSSSGSGGGGVNNNGVNARTPDIVHHQHDASSGGHYTAYSYQQQQHEQQQLPCVDADSNHSSQVAASSPIFAKPKTSCTAVGADVNTGNDGNDASSSHGTTKCPSGGIAAGRGSSGTCLTTLPLYELTRLPVPLSPSRLNQSHSQSQQQFDSVVLQQASSSIPSQLHSRLDAERAGEASSSLSLSSPQSQSESCNIAATGTTASFIKNPYVNKSTNKFNKYKSATSGKASGAAAAGPSANVHSVTTNVINSVSADSSNSNSNSASVTNARNSARSAKMVAAQDLSEVNDGFDDFDPSEELQYGPGIVSKLRCRYLSLALRQSAGKQRPALDNLRRATSLNNLLDDDDRGSNSSCTTGVDHTAAVSHATVRPSSENLGKSPDEFVATFQKNLKLSDKQRSRHVKRGNDSMKRARSVEALLVYGDKAWENDSPTVTAMGAPVQMRYSYIQRLDSTKTDLSPISPSAEITIEDKIISARERNSITDKPPRKITPFMDETERPPPDVVKQTLKIFEATANKRGRGLSRNNCNGEVATKVRNYKSIISQEKPPIIFPKPPLSPKKAYRKPGTPPGNLDIAAAKKMAAAQQQIPTNNMNGNGVAAKKPFTTGSVSPGLTSPINSISKKLNNISAEIVSTNDSIPHADSLSPTAEAKNVSPPVPSVRTTIPFRLNAKNESTPIRATYDDGSHSPQITPDVIPRKMFDSGPNFGAAVDSPVTQLTKQLERLKIESPALALSTSASSAPISPSVGTISPIAKAPQKLVRSSESEGDDDDSVDSEHFPKRVSKSALDNISKAGTTQQFNFSNANKSPHQLSSSRMNGSSNACAVSAQPVGSNSVKQIGVIRPLLAEPKPQQQLQQQQQQSSDNSKLKHIPPNASPAALDRTPSTDDLITAKARDNLVISNLSQQPLHQQPQLNNLSSKVNNTNATNSYSSNSSRSNQIDEPVAAATIVLPQPPQRPTLTSREIEKNLINTKKIEEANLLEAANNSTTSSCTSNTTSTSDSNGVKWQLAKKKVRHAAGSGGSSGGPQPLPQQPTQNTMIFNFKDRKEVPDYIENDGLLFRRKRELPKPNESGFVLLGDLSLETSTDPDDDWTMGPPSPCDVEFANANIIIDGKSSIRSKSREISLRVQFDDTLTSTFEYPSESSMHDDTVDTATMNIVNSDTLASNVITATATTLPTSIIANNSTTTATTTEENYQKNPGQKLLGSMSLGSAPLGSYIPMKAQINTSFELGVTRNPDTETSDTNSTKPTNGNSSDNDNTTSTSKTKNNSCNSNGIDYIMNGSSCNNDEPESLQYLKPATDDLTVVYSEGTQKTDLLY